jgi:hypothetical protein
MQPPKRGLLGRARGAKLPQPTRRFRVQARIQPCRGGGQRRVDPTIVEATVC